MAAMNTTRNLSAFRDIWLRCKSSNPLEKSSLGEGILPYVCSGAGRESLRVAPASPGSEILLRAKRDLAKACLTRETRVLPGGGHQTPLQSITDLST